MNVPATFGPHPALMKRRDDHPALCQLVSDWRGRVSGDGAIVEPKRDGIRALYIAGELVTREGSPILGAGHIVAALKAIEHAAAIPLFFDGEWLVSDSFDATQRHFQARGSKGYAGTLHLFDALPMWTWRGEEPGTALYARKTRLEEMLAGSDPAVLRAVPWAYVSDPAEIEAHAADFIAKGGEGVVVKDPFATYRRKQDQSWQRIKKRLTLDLPVVGYEPDEKRPFLLGVLVVDHRGKKVRVSAGFSDVERMALWRRRESLIGSIHEIAAMEVTASGSLRQPRWVRERADKAGSAYYGSDRA